MRIVEGCHALATNGSTQEKRAFLEVKNARWKAQMIIQDYN